MSQRPHVAVLDEELPYPVDSGKRLRTWNLLSRLAGRYRITYISQAMADADATKRAAEFVADHGITPVVVPRAIPEKRGVGFLARVGYNLVQNAPYSAVSHRCPALVAAARELARLDPPALWHAEWTPYADHVVQMRPDAPWLVMAHNVETRIWERYAESETNTLKRLFLASQARKYRRFEREIYSAAPLTIAVSQPDAELIRTEFGGRNVRVVDNGVDCRRFTPTPEGERDPYRMIFLGSLDWRPNLDAIEQMLGLVLPKLRAVDPRFVLDVVGRNPSPTLIERCRVMDGVELHADVPDTRPHLAHAGLMVVPLRVGGGSRLKILESLATETPVVSTKIGAEGLDLTHEQHLTIAEIDRFADAIIAGVGRLSDQARAGRKRVEAAYDWDPLANALADCWDSLMAGCYRRAGRGGITTGMANGFAACNVGLVEGTPPILSEE